MHELLQITSHKKDHKELKEVEIANYDIILNLIKTFHFQLHTLYYRFSIIYGKWHIAQNLYVDIQRSETQCVASQAKPGYATKGLRVQKEHGDHWTRSQNRIFKFINHHIP